MTKPVFAVAGDLHLSPHITKLLPDMTWDSVHSLNQISEFCATKRIDLVLAGDVSDTTHPGSGEIGALKSAVKDIQAVGRNVYGIQGQHDMADPPWLVIADAISLNENLLKIGGLSVYGLDYRTKTELQEDLANVPPCDTLVLHQMLAESVNFINPDGDPKYDLEADDIPKHIKLCVMADIHEGPYENKKHKPPIYYTGSTHMRKISEPPEKSFLVVNDDLSVKRIRLNTRPFHSYELFTEEGLTDALKWFRTYERPDVDDPHEVYKPYVIIKFSHDLENVRERVIAAAGDRFHYRLLPLGSVEQIGQQTDEVRGSVTLEDCLGEFIRPDSDPDLHDFAKELIRANDPRPVIEAWRKKVVGA